MCAGTFERSCTLDSSCVAASTRISPDDNRRAKRMSCWGRTLLRSVMLSAAAAKKICFMKSKRILSGGLTIHAVENPLQTRLALLGLRVVVLDPPPFSKALPFLHERPQKPLRAESLEKVSDREEQILPVRCCDTCDSLRERLQRVRQRRQCVLVLRICRNVFAPLDGTGLLAERPGAHPPLPERAVTRLPERPRGRSWVERLVRPSLRTPGAGAPRSMPSVLKSSSRSGQ